MKTPQGFACLVILSLALTSCGNEETPSAPNTLSPRAEAVATTNQCTNHFLGELSAALSQWEIALETERGADILATPPSFAGDVDAYATALSPLLGDWEDSLETWRGSDFLSSPPVFNQNVNAYFASLAPTLATWEDSLEAWRGKDFLVTPPVFVADTKAPEIVCPADTTINCGGPEGMPVTFEVAVSDSCDSAPVLVCTPPSGAVFPEGTTAVSCVATDADGNISQCSFNVTVGVDSIAPVIVCPADITLECTGNDGATYVFAATATDNCDPAPVVVSVPPSGSFFPLGTTTVTSTATDAAGNSAVCTFLVTVVDTQPPVLEVISILPPTLWPPNHKMVDIAVEVSAVDACEGEVSSWIDKVTSNESVNGRGDGNTEPDWEITGPLEVSLRAERQGGGEGRVYTLVIKAMDSAGNTAEKTVEVPVPHDSGHRSD
jgi:hypothetical protein